MSRQPVISPLIIAEAANPEWSSVPLVGWSHSQAIAQLTEAHIVTQIRNRDAFLKAGVPENAFTAIDSEAVARRVYKLSEWLRGGSGKGWTTVTAFNAISYYYFEKLLWKQFGPAIKGGKYSLVHRVTPLSPTIPSLLARKCRKAGVPFILGPLNGGLPWPKEFDSERRAEKEWLSYLRNAYKLLPGYSSTRKHAAALIMGSQETYKQMPTQYHGKCVYVPENGIDLQRFRAKRTRKTQKPVRVIFVGRLVPYKGADMLVEAATPLLKSHELQIKIIGDGPDRPKIEALLKASGIKTGVELTGWLEHGQIAEHLANADLLCFPSIREFGGAVALEAMAVGLVPIVVRYGGPGELVTPDTGFLLEIGSRAAIVKQLRSLLEILVQRPEEIDSRSEPARARVMRHFTWAAKAGQTVEIYRWVLGQRPDKPDFGMPISDLNEIAINPEKEVQNGSH